MNPIELSLFLEKLESVGEEMGATLRRTAFSPNIRDRLDFSCAVFDARGALCSQAAHIPVHLGSMAFAMVSIVEAVDWQSGDMLVVNDPFSGGTHLPDVTLVAPVFVGTQLCGFVANRAHHADIGCDSPGSMPIARHLHEEGRVIPPTLLMRHHQVLPGVLAQVAMGLEDLPSETRSQTLGDFHAQIAANRLGQERLARMIEEYGVSVYLAGMETMQTYAEKLARSSLAHLPQGSWSAHDCLDDDGVTDDRIPLCCRLTVTGSSVRVDFTGSAPQVAGNVNCPLAVTAAAVYYVFRCMMPSDAPVCAGLFRPITLDAPDGSVVNARFPAAVAAGNVETSSRLVDLVLRALSSMCPGGFPAASQGTMNNLAMGWHDPDSNSGWDYYETLAGGIGAGPVRSGLSMRHSHMTNTLNTPVERIESVYPLRVTHYGRRRASGGMGRHAGGDGVIREYQFLAKAKVTLLTDRRRTTPWGVDGGAAGMPGCNRLNEVILPGKVAVTVQVGDRLRIETPGGGGFGISPGQLDAPDA